MLEGRLAPSVYHVNSLLDGGAGSGLSGDLRYCITQANSHPGQDTIGFDVRGTISLTSSLPALSDNVDIQGPGAAGLTVSGNHSFDLFAVHAGVTGSLSGLTISGGSTTSGGGGRGIVNAGTLTVAGVTVSSNWGGGAYNRGMLTVSDSTFSSNIGPGLLNDGTATVTSCTFTGNIGTGRGGGIQNTGRLTVSNSTLSGNSMFAPGMGAGIDTTTTAGQPVTLTNVTITGNTASGTAAGGGLHVGAGLPVLRNTLIAANFTDASVPHVPDDVSGAVASSSDHNLIGVGTGLTGITNGVNGNKVGSAASPINPRLAPLADNGGPTQTNALLPGSPARDAGNNAYATAYDQRGPGFPRVVGPAIDIGAFESLSQPTTYHVNSLLDTGAGSGTSGDLRYCITQANSNPGRDSITFDVTGTIALNSALPALADDVDVQGPGASQLKVSGTSFDGMRYHYTQIFTVNAGVTASLSGLALTDGTAPNTGAPAGGINNAGTLTVSNCFLSGNSGASFGGAISNTGTLTITSSTLGGNHVGATPLGSYGGAIYNTGTLTVSNSTLRGNSAAASAFPAIPGVGGGIYNNGTLTVSNSALFANGAVRGGGIANGGTATIAASTISGNTASEGGGIQNSGTLTLRDSTLSGNTAFVPIRFFTGGAGGITNTGGLTVSNSTLSGNSTENNGRGAGIDTTTDAAHPVKLTNVTITNNMANDSSATGGGLRVGGGLPLLQNALIAGNLRRTSSTPVRDDVLGAVASASDHNLIGDGTGLTGISNGANGNKVGSATAPLDPLLGPLAYNGGPTQTHALLAGSPAINAGNNAYATANDQRGTGFPRVVGGTIDVGAFEVQTQTTYHVTSLLDAGAGSGLSGDLRYCITQANARPAQSTIVFDVRGTITLGRALPALTHGVAISGPGAASLTVNGAYVTRVFLVNAGGSASISGVTIANGLATSDPTAGGGGIDNGGTLTLSSSTLSGNYTSSAGGGIYNTGTLIVSSCALSGNSADGSGGGVENRGGTVTVSGSTLSGNYGGGNGGAIDNTGLLTLSTTTLSGNYSSGNGGGLSNAPGGLATVTILASTLGGNATSGSGGGIENLAGGTVTVSGSTVSGGYAVGNGGGIDNAGTLTLSSSTLSGNSSSANGGGLANSLSSATATLDTSTVSGNGAAGDGGGLASSGTLRVLTTTVSGNYASGNGGGLASAGELIVSASTFSGNGASGNGGGLLTSAGAATLSNSTVYGNYSGLQGAGVYAASGGAADMLTLTNVTLAANYAGVSGGGLFVATGAVAAPVLHNTLVAYNASGPNGTPDDVFGALAGGSDHNLISDGSGMTGISNGVNGNMVGSDASPIDPLLGPLQDNGGPTQTCALLLGSPARGGGSTTYATATDQRGLPRVVNGLIDIGAYQTQDYSM